MSYVELKEYLRTNGVSQREVVSKLISAGFYSEDERQSLKSRVCMALNGKRVSDSYKLLLQQIEFVVSKAEL